MSNSTAAYIVNNNKLLLLLRDNIPTIKDPNKWDTPGGGCEGSESFLECLKRELIEELELKPDDSRFYFLWESITPKGNKEHSFLIRISDAEMESMVLHEGQSMKFFDFQDLEKLKLTEHLTVLFPSKKDLIKKFLSE